MMIAAQALPSLSRSFLSLLAIRQSLLGGGPSGLGLFELIGHCRLNAEEMDLSVGLDHNLAKQPLQEAVRRRPRPFFDFNMDSVNAGGSFVESTAESLDRSVVFDRNPGNSSAADALPPDRSQPSRHAGRHGHSLPTDGKADPRMKSDNVECANSPPSVSQESTHPN